ncbi:MAG: PorP/SprF family type IX secretion system membrane protein [Paludibacteraceae bacterium]|nr:PorP/SprF family type IX secretion system membrane protein [Paludibacteraceae bacterium]
MQNATCKLVLALLMLSAASAMAQTDPQMGHYMHLQTTYNPAAAGEGDLLRVAGMHRMQYTGITDMPMSTYFTFSSPFNILKTKHAVGVRFLNDKYGFFMNQAFHVQYAYRHKIGNGYLSAGVDLGFVNMSFKSDSVNLDQIVSELGDGSESFSDNDPVIPKGSGKDGSNGMTFDMGLGLYYSAPTWWAGISYSHVTRPTVEWSDNSSIRLIGTLYMAGGYIWKIKRNRNWTLKPSMMVMTDFVNWDVNLTMMAEVKERFRFGAGYRIAGSVNILLGMDIISGLQLGYTYELPANRLIKATYGSHELFLSYAFNVLRPKRTNKYKSVRYL